MLSPLDAACDSQQTRNTICLTAMKHGRGHWLSTLYQTHRNVTKCQACYIERYYTPFQTSILQPRQRYGHMVLIAHSYGLLRTVKQPWANTPPPSNRNPSLHIREKQTTCTIFGDHEHTESHRSNSFFCDIRSRLLASVWHRGGSQPVEQRTSVGWETCERFRLPI